MDPSQEKKSYSIDEDEKVTSVMVYTDTHLFLGDVILKKAIKVSLWLPPPAIPQFIHLHNCNLVLLNSVPPNNTLTLHETFIPISHVIGFHIKPPAHDPLDYDPNTTNRKMEPVSAIIGHFRMDGYLRMSTQTSIDKFLDVSKELFISLYDVDISQIKQDINQNFHVPFVLARLKDTIFSPRIIKS